MSTSHQSRTQKPESFAAAMKELETLNQWFQSDDIDLEQGLEKLQQAKVLIQYCQNRLSAVEGEFLELRQAFDTTSSEEQDS